MPGEEDLRFGKAEMRLKKARKTPIVAMGNNFQPVQEYIELTSRLSRRSLTAALLEFHRGPR